MRMRVIREGFMGEVSFEIDYEDVGGGIVMGVIFLAEGKARADVWMLKVQAIFEY